MSVKRRSTKNHLFNYLHTVIFSSVYVLQIYHYGYTFFMIEHDIEFISALCEPVIVMTEGSILTEDSAENIRNDDRVIEAYLGN